MGAEPLNYIRSALEAVGLEAALIKLEGAKIDILKFCHDAKAEQKTIIKKTPRYKNSKSRLDLWHAKKTIMKTFNKAMNKKFYSGRAAAKVLQTKKQEERTQNKEGKTHQSTNNKQQHKQQ